MGTRRGEVRAAWPVLDGARLRLWAVGAGRRDEHGYLLRLSPHDPPVWDAAGAALARSASPAPSSARAGGPAYRVTGRRRLIRLGEYVGERPAAVAAEDWPA